MKENSDPIHDQVSKIVRCESKAVFQVGVH